MPTPFTQVPTTRAESGVDLSMPESCSARVLTQVECPSTSPSAAGCPPVTASSSPRVGSSSPARVLSQRPPRSHAPSESSDAPLDRSERAVGKVFVHRDSQAALLRSAGDCLEHRRVHVALRRLSRSALDGTRVRGLEPYHSLFGDRARPVRRHSRILDLDGQLRAAPGVSPADRLGRVPSRSLEGGPHHVQTRPGERALSQPFLNRQDAGPEVAHRDHGGDARLQVSPQNAGGVSFR